MASPAKPGAKEKAAQWAANKGKIALLISRGLEVNQIEDELHKSGCRITSQLREYIIWEKRAPEVRQLVAQRYTVAAIEERMRLNGWIWTDTLRKKALWEFHREEIIKLYRLLHSVESVREAMFRKGFTPQTRIYYAWLRSWGIPTSIRRPAPSEIDALSPYGSNNSATPGSTVIPAYEPAIIGSSHSSLGDLVSGRDWSRPTSSSHQPLTNIPQVAEGHSNLYDASASLMDFDEELQLGTLNKPSRWNTQTMNLPTSSNYNNSPRADASYDLHNNHGYHLLSAQNGAFSDYNDESDAGEDTCESRPTRARKDTTLLQPNNTALYQLLSDQQNGIVPQGEYGYGTSIQRTSAHRESSDSGYRSKKTSMQSSGFESATSSRPESIVKNNFNQESDLLEQALPKTLLHSVPCSEIHQERNLNFSCCGSSCLQDLALSGVNGMPPQEVYERLCHYIQMKTVRLHDYAGNTFLHKIAVTGMRWEYFEAGINAGIDPCHRNAYGQTFAHVLNVSAFQGNLTGCLASLRALNIDFGLRDASGRTVLHCLFSQPMSPLTARQVLKLIDAPGRQLALRDVSGRTPCGLFKETFLRHASRSPRRSTAELELQMLGVFEDIVEGGVRRVEDEDVDLSKIRDTGENLHTLLQDQYKQVIAKAENGIVAEAADGSNAFHAQAGLATIHDAPTDLQSLEKSISIGVDANDYDDSGKTPLEAIITQPRDYETELTTSEKVSLLINRGGANIHSRNRLGHTPLFSAAIRGLDRTVEVLLLRGSHPNIRSNDNHSLLQSVTEACHRAFVEYLESGYCRYHEAQCSRIEGCKELLVRYGAVDDPTPAQAMGYPPRCLPTQ